ncbi:MAG: hypothetical protein AB1758_25990 [Candidatus Eremiobacterota bacterium]
MIVVMGATTEEMVAWVYRELESRGAPVSLIETKDIPSRVTFEVSLPGPTGFLELADGKRINLEDIQSVYTRVGFTDYSNGEDYSRDEVSFVNSQCHATFNTLLNELPALVVNRPVSSNSNGSKPHQAALISAFGFRTPETLVTNDPALALEFYELHHGNLIYKSVSYIRSIVQRMTEGDFERLEYIPNCPVQLQECIQGFDVRVHVISDRAVFASRIRAEKSDYRYDKSTRITPYDLPDEVAQRCVDVTRALGLNFSGIDLRCTPEGEYVCFEVNPCPAYAYYEKRSGQPITATLCDYLLSRATPATRSFEQLAAA